MKLRRLLLFLQAFPLMFPGIPHAGGASGPIATTVDGEIGPGVLRETILHFRSFSSCTDCTDPEILAWGEERLSEYLGYTEAVREAREGGDALLVDALVQSQLMHALGARFGELVPSASEEIEEAVLQARYEDQYRDFQSQDLIRHRLVFVSSATSETQQDWEQARKRCEEALGLLRAGADFTGVVARYDDRAAEVELRAHPGLAPFGRLNPEVEARLLSLKEGEYSDPLRVNHGWVILANDGIVPSATKPDYESVRQTLRQTVRDERTRDAMDRLRIEAAAIPVERRFDVLLDPDAPPDAVIFSTGKLAFRKFDLQRKMEPYSPEYLADFRMIQDDPAAIRRWLEARIGDFRLAEYLLRDRERIPPEIEREAEARGLEAAGRYLLARSVAAGLQEPAEEDLRLHFQRYPQEWMYEPGMTGWHIGFVVESRPGESPQETELRYLEAWDRAEALVERIRAGEDMEKLAREHSDLPNAPEGGRISREAAKSDPLFKRLARENPPGTLIGPVRERDTVWILKMGQPIPAQIRPFEEVRDLVKDHWWNQKTGAGVRKRFGEIAREANLKLIDHAFLETYHTCFPADE